jgi:hypothetical protein
VAAGLADAQRGSGLAGRVAATNPELAARLQSTGTTLRTLSEFGVKYLDPIEGPYRATVGRVGAGGMSTMDVARSSLGDLARRGIASDSSLSGIVDTVLPPAETIRTRRGLDATVRREGEQGMSQAAQPILEAERAAFKEAADQGAPLVQPGFRDTFRRATGKAEKNRTLDSLLDVQDEIVTGATLPREVGTARKVAVLEASGAYDQIVETYRKFDSMGKGQEWIDDWNRAHASAPDALRAFGEDIKALADYKKREGIFDGVDGKIRARYVQEYAVRQADLSAARTAAELAGVGRTGDTPMDPTQTADVRPVAYRDVFDPETESWSKQPVEVGVTQGAIDAERQAIDTRITEKQKRLEKVSARAAKVRRESDVQGAVADELAGKVADNLPGLDEMRRRGVSEQRAKAQEQAAKAGARRDAVKLARTEKRQATLAERAKQAEADAAVAKARVTERAAQEAEAKAVRMEKRAENATRAAGKTDATDEIKQKAVEASDAAAKARATANTARNKADAAARKVAETAVPPRDALPGEAGAAPASPNFDRATRSRLNRSIGAGPPTPRQEAAAERLAARDLAAKAADASKRANDPRLAAVADRARSAASDSLNTAERMRGRGDTAGAFAKATKAERDALSIVRGTRTKDGRVTTSMARRVFKAEGRKVERTISATREAAILERSIKRLYDQRGKVEEILSKSAQDVVADVGRKAVTSMTNLVRAQAGDLGEVRSIPVPGNKPPRLQLTGEVGKVIREADQFYGPAGIGLNDRVTAALVKRSEELGGGVRVSLTAKETLATTLDALNEAKVTLRPDQMTRLQHAADVGTALERAEDLMLHGDLNRTYMGAPEAIARAMEETIPWLPDDARTRLRKMSSDFQEQQTRALWSQKQLGAVPGVARQAAIVGREAMEALIEKAREYNAQIPGSGDIFYQFADDIATSYDQIVEAGMDPVHLTGGKAPDFVGVDSRIKQTKLRSEYRKETSQMPLTPDAVARMEQEQAINRARNVAYRRVMGQVTYLPQDMPVLKDFAQQWMDERGISRLTKEQWRDVIAKFNESAKNKKQRLSIIEPDAVDKAAYQRAKARLDKAERQLANAKRVEGQVATKTIDDLQREVDQAQLAFDDAERMMQTRVMTEATNDALVKWKADGDKEIPLLLRPIARLNTIYKSWALALSPRWWMNQMLGNPVMATMYGGLGPLQSVRGFSNVRGLARQFNGDVQSMLESGVMDAGVADILYNIGGAPPVDLLPGGRARGAGIRGTEITEGGITTNERRATRPGSQGGELKNTAVGNRLRENSVVQAKGLFTEWGYGIGSQQDALWRAAVMSENIRKVARKFATNDPATGFRTLRDTPLTADDLTAADVDTIVATAHNEMLKAMGDFSRMSSFERRILRHIIPFWSWIRHSNTAFLRLHVEHPRRVIWMAHLANLFADPDLTDRERAIIAGMLPIDENSFLNVGSLLSPVPDDAAESLYSPVGFGPTLGQGMSPAINFFVAAATGISMGRGSQATRPGGVGSYYKPLIGEPGNLLGYTLNKNLPPQFRALRDLIQGPGPRYDTGQKKETGTFQGPMGGRAGSLAKLAGIPVPENIDLERVRG